MTNDIDLDPLKKALLTFETALAEAHEGDSLVLRDGVIKRFEYTFELSWKLIQKYIAKSEQLAEPPVPSFSKKELFRTAAQKGFIADPAIWFRYLEARNVAAHMYDAIEAGRVYDLIQDFSLAVRDLLHRLGSRS